MLILLALNIDHTMDATKVGMAMYHYRKCYLHRFPILLLLSGQNDGNVSAMSDFVNDISHGLTLIPLLQQLLESHAREGFTLTDRFSTRGLLSA